LDPKSKNFISFTWVFTSVNFVNLKLMFNQYQSLKLDFEKR
jgi:hypothetical protein